MYILQSQIGTISGCKMLNSEKDEEVLTHLGLSRSQAKIYATMSKCGTLNAATIWKTTKVARQDLYRILNELQEIGLVEKILVTPSQYRAIPMAEAVSMLYQKKKSQITQLQTEVVDFIESQCQNKQEIYPDQYNCAMIPQKEHLYIRSEQTFKCTQRTICLSSTFKRLLESLPTKMISEACDRGIQVRIIVNTEEKNWFEKLEQPYFRKPNFKIRCIHHLPPSAFIIFDEKECYISTITDAGFLGARCLWSNYPSIIILLQSYFDMQWDIAQENVKQTTALAI
jgi:sugar-specific transcriptional regulator TrmB